MTTALITHPACLDHDTGPFHPERPDRLRRVLQALEHPRFSALLRDLAPLATEDQLARVHPPEYIRAILDIAPEPGQRINLDADTVMSAGSREAALRAAGAAIMAVDAVMQGWAKQVFAAVRPPGHHAERDRPMGFCLFANAAIAARHAQAQYGLTRIAVVDFDVHHGNGTQAIFEKDRRVLYLSSHQLPLYPNTGQVGEHGVGNIVNAPLPPGSNGDLFRKAWSETLLPVLDAFAPQLLLLSAGFDGHRLDPLADLRLEAEDYRWLSAELARLAEKHCRGRLVSVLEGGYSLTALRECSVAHLQGLEAGTTR